MLKDELIERIQAHKARIGVVGLGYVGLPLVLRFGEERFPVLGFDVDPVKVRKLNAGESYIRHIQAERLQTLLKAKQFEATSEFSRLAEADCIIICVPTPLTAKKDPDLQYIEKTADAIHKTLRTTSWSSHPSERTRETRSFRHARFPRWWVELRRIAWKLERRFTARSLIG